MKRHHVFISLCLKIIKADQQKAIGHAEKRKLKANIATAPVLCMVFYNLTIMPMVGKTVPLSLAMDSRT